MVVKTALISVSDKRGIEDFAYSLHKLGIKIISTKGTAKIISSKGIPVKMVEEITEFPEILDGRIKTLHPKIHGGILFNREVCEHERQIRMFNIEQIDMVVANLYPFTKIVSKPNISLEQAIENIDIGGTVLIRSAAKNYRNVVVIVDPYDYKDVLNELYANKNDVSLTTKEKLAVKAFSYTAFYDSIISSFFREIFNVKFPKYFTLGFIKSFKLRYGENPHQEAAFYKSPITYDSSISNTIQLHGKKLSFNNIYDANTAIEMVKEFKEPFAVIIKHSNPCGASISENVSDAFRKALECDPISAFGGVIAVNRECDEKTAKQIASFFNEIVIAPSYTEEALNILKQKKNIRILQLKRLVITKPIHELDLKKVSGGILIQERDVYQLKRSDMKVMTKRGPTEKEIVDMIFGWKIVKYTKSNAVILVRDKATVGIGAGQMSRIDSVKLACEEAGRKAVGSVAVSDGFFPFSDSINKLAEFGVKAIIQPGGSIRDIEVIETANKYGIAVVFTGHRCFKH